MDERIGEVYRSRDAPPDAALLGGDNRLDLIEFRILPKFAAILQDIGCDLRDILPVIPFHDVQGEVNARGQAAGSGDLSVVDESGSAHEVHGRVLFLHARREHVVRCGGRAVEQAILGEHRGAGANRHRDVGRRRIRQQPCFLRIAAAVLRWDDNDLRLGRSLKAIVGNDHKPVGGSHGL